MKKSILAIVFVASASMLLAGCGGPAMNAQQRLQFVADGAAIYAAEVAVARINHELDARQAAGKIDAATYQAARNATASAADVLNRAADHLATGTPWTLDEKAAVAKSFFDNINAVLIAKGLPPLPAVLLTPPVPATQPI